MGDSTERAKGPGKGGHRFQAPKGTRDFYPEDLLRQRYMVETWRAVSLRHGFEEIDGPTFEHLELYTVKSGEGIVSELFSFQRAGGEDAYALRPEFTPTLARMYAAKANTLSKPVRWFCVPRFFRAERPQRGRLREFLQWNCDVIGGGGLNAEGAENAEKIETQSDGDTIAPCGAALRDFGFSDSDARIRFSDRRVSDAWAKRAGISSDRFQTLCWMTDNAGKMSPQQLNEAADRAGVTPKDRELFENYMRNSIEIGRSDLDPVEQASRTGVKSEDIKASVALMHRLDDLGFLDWWQFDASIVRGLAYYTGMVFEVIAEGERAVAGGGRYDNLIELLGGPPTPAVGFAMGDVVLGNLLEDKGLMPSGAELAQAVEAVVRSQRIRPEVFVVAGSEEDAAMVTPLVARLRRGVEREGFGGKPWEFSERYEVRPLHARSSDKATRNVKKLLQDAVKQGARFYCEIHGADKVELKDLDRQESVDPPSGYASFSVDPGAPNYVGRGVVGE